jgi:1-deoxy-D-xylulose-5-phosphate synthase
MSLLDTIHGPADVRALAPEQLQALADEVRQRLIEVVSQTGLGVVELTVALLHEFDSPHDKIVWDVGHQGYPWKVLTGRNPQLPTLRQEGGLSGFLRRAESKHDIFGAGHAGTAISAAYGIATARDLRGEDFHVIAVVGDGSMTCGLPYEGLNNAGHADRDMLIILNDNGMSIAPNVGAMSRYLGSVIASPFGNRMRERVKHTIEAASHVVGGKRMVDLARNLEESIKNLWSPGMLFEELGFRYFGPINGHDLPTLLRTFQLVKSLKGPRLIQVLTEKGRGFPLDQPDREKFHARNPYDPITGVLKPVKRGRPAWTKVFGEAITTLAEEHPELVAITAAMPSGTGTNIFEQRWPERFFDVGIAEGHATTFAAGLATQGIRPIVAIYSTFLQRGYDNVIHDVAIQKLPVIFCLDRAGMVGADGQTHMGLYDIAYMLAVPNMTVTAPRDAGELIGLLRCAIAQDGPFSIRYPRDSVPGDVPPVADVPAVPYGTWEVLRQGHDCAILAVGVMCAPALAAADQLAAAGFHPTVVNCRFLKPMDQATIDALLHDHRVLVTVEDGTMVNGFGAGVAARVADVAPETRVGIMGAPDRTWEHAPRASQLAAAGLTAEAIAERVRQLAVLESLSPA